MKSVDASVPVLITGASSGIGEEFARQFAARGHDLVLVARRVNRLEQLAAELTKAHGVVVTTEGADLETADGRQLVSARLTAAKHPWILINNAGFGTSGRFATLDADREAAEVTLNVVAVQQLTRAALPVCIKHRGGGVINVASTAAYQALPFMATYSATKAFVLHFTEAVAVETHNSGVRVMALCPGPVNTEFNRVAGLTSQLDMLFPISVERCVSDAMKAFDRNRTIVIPGVSNALLAHSTRVAPRAMTRRITGAILRRN